MNQLVHIAYGDSAAGCLRSAIKLGMLGDIVVVSRDDFTQGPISDCIYDGGLVQRSQYWSSLKTLHSQQKDFYDHYASSLKSIDSIASKTKIVLWIGDSSHDRISTAWILTYLKNKNINWQYVDLKDVVTTIETPIVNLALLSAEQVRDHYVSVKSISKELEEQYLKLWNNLSNDNTQYRIQKDESILSVGEDYYDSFILSHITKKSQLLGKLMGAIMGKSEHRLTDTTIESRLVVLQSQNKIKIELSLVSIFMSKVKLR